MLPYAQPCRLEVRTTPQQLRGPPWETVAHCWEGQLRLRFPSGTKPFTPTPCDDLLTPLHGKRSQLVEFSGAIAEATSVATLASISAPMSALNVCLLTPLSLRALHGRCEGLEVLVRPFETTYGCPRLPLPAQPRPLLWVTDIQQGAWRDVVHTVETLAPDDMSYAALRLQLCDLNEGELDRTVAALQRGGIRTVHEGPTGYQRFFSGEIWLRITDELPQYLAFI